MVVTIQLHLQSSALSPLNRLLELGEPPEEPSFHWISSGSNDIAKWVEFLEFGRECSSEMLSIYFYKNHILWKVSGTGLTTELHITIMTIFFT